MKIMRLLWDRPWHFIDVYKRQTIRITGNHGENVPNGCASNTTNGKKAKINIAFIRAA